MRARLVLAGIAVIVIALVAVLAMRSCTGSGRARTSGATGAGGASGATGERGAASKGARTPRGPVQPASLAGRVTRVGDGSGIAGAVVTITPAELLAMFVSSGSPTRIAITDASGGWSAKGIAPGAYIVAATAKGFVPGSREKLTVGSGEQQAGLDLALAAGGTTVSGMVSDVGGGPIADARITATVSRNMPYLWGRADFATTTGPDGRYELTLADGEYSVEATHDDYTNDREHADVKGSPLAIDFTLVPGAVIRGQVVARDSGDPVPGALVNADSSNGGDSTAAADASGNFTLRGLDAGAIELQALGRGYASRSPTVVAVGIGEQLDGIKVLVDRAYSISGRVVRKGKTDQGIAGVTLGAFSIAAKAFGLALEPSAEDGSFEIVGLKPASYMIGAIDEGSVPEVGQNVDVVDKDVEDVIIELSAGATISGRVEPALANVEISIAPSGGIGLATIMEAAKSMLVRAQTDASGAFVLKHVPSGSFKLHAMAPDGHAGALALTVADVDQSGLVVKLESRASVSGRVIDTSNKPVGGARVVSDRIDRDAGAGMNISFGPGGSSPSTTTAADGSFKLVGLEAGKYRIYVRDEDDMLSQIRNDSDQPTSKDTTVVELTATTVKTGVTLTVDARDAVIRGTVVSSDGKAVADAWVTGKRVIDKPKDLPKEAEQYFDGEGSPTEPVLTNESGQFTIGKLRKGTYNLVATGSRGSSRGEKRAVKAGESVTIQLAALGTLDGKVTAGGAPVPKYDIECDGPGADVERSIDAADGSYLLERLAPGPYTCTVNSDTGTATAKVDVPAGPVTVDLSLTRWGTVTGTVVSVLDKRPLAGIHAFTAPEGGSGWSSRDFAEVIAGNAPTSDAAGRFAIKRVAAGKGKVSFMPKDAFMPLGTRDYSVAEGQLVDVGTIEVIPPRTGDAGTLGLATNVDGDKLVVTAVKEGGPAAAAGVQVGDRIVSIGSATVASLTPQVAQQAISSGTIGVGQTVALTLERGGQTLQATVTSVKW